MRRWECTVVVTMVAAALLLAGLPAGATYGVRASGAGATERLALPGGQPAEGHFSDCTGATYGMIVDYPVNCAKCKKACADALQACTPGG
jgi:hypothetical protein